MLRIRELRVDCGLQQKQIAQDLHLSKQVYSNYELGQREPSIDMLGKLADYFGVTVDYLIGRDDKAQTEPFNEPFKTKKSPALSEEDEAMLNTYLELSDDSKRVVRYTVNMYAKSENINIDSSEKRSV